MTSLLPRALCALLTPFDDAGEIDLDAVGHNVSALAAAGMPAVLVAGSTGEGPLLEQGERRALATAAHEAGASTLLVGVAAESVRQALALVSEAVDAEADAALLLAPTGIGRGNPVIQARFFRAVAERSPIPVMIYSITRNTGFAIATEVVADLAGVTAGMKDSDGDVGRLGVLASNPGFPVFTGSSPSVAGAVARGCQGAITASANYLPSVLSAVVDGTRGQADLDAVTGPVESHGLAGTAHAAACVGLRSGRRRPPLDDELTPDAKREIERATSDLPRLA